MRLNQLRFTPQLLTKPKTRGIDVETALRHFVIITYLVEPDKLRQFHPRSLFSELAFILARTASHFPIPLEQPQNNPIH